MVEVKHTTAMPSSFAFAITGFVASESTAHTIIASHPAEMKFSNAVICFAESLSQEFVINVQPVASASFCAASTN